MTEQKKLLLLQLNELNFDIVKDYFNDSKLPNLKKIFKDGYIQTYSETEYDLLEPWIQWVSVNTGMSAHEHGVFRLGDITKSNHKQLYEIVEESGYNVGAIIPMNTKNNLNNPSYFISDPWTRTEDSKDFLIRQLSNAISQIVNDNAKRKISFKNLIYLLYGLLKFVRFKNYLKMLYLALTGINHKWRWAIFLDLFLNDLHLKLVKSSRPNFSSLFLNCAAHVQHHYFFNSKKNIRKNPSWYLGENFDPFKEVLVEYDNIIGDFMKLYDYQLIIATGLSQEVSKQAEFYYRLDNHSNFLKIFNINYKRVMPRMTRDFLIEFENLDEAKKAQDEIENLTTSDGERIFGIVDNRGESLFISLTYNREIKKELIVKNRMKDREVKLYEYTSFVALKNGIHNPNGYAYFSNDVQYIKGKEIHVKELFNIILNYFSIPVRH